MVKQAVYSFKSGSVTVFVELYVDIVLSVFVFVPGNDEGSACAGLNTSSCTDSTWGLNAR